MAAPAHSRLRQTHSHLRKTAIRTLIVARCLRLRWRVEARASLRPAGRRERHLPESCVRVARARAMSCADALSAPMRFGALSACGRFASMRPPAAYRCILRAACYMSPVVCCMLHVACCVLHVACSMLRVACCVSHVACRMLHFACCVLHVACCMLRVACCVLRAACCRLLSVARCVLPRIT